MDPKWTRNGTPKWTQNGPKMDPKWTQNGPKMDPKWTQNGPEMDPKWTRNGPKMDQKWTQNGPEMDPKWTQNGPEMDPKWTKNGPTRWHTYKRIWSLTHIQARITLKSSSAVFEFVWDINVDHNVLGNGGANVFIDMSGKFLAPIHSVDKVTRNRCFFLESRASSQWS